MIRKQQQLLQSIGALISISGFFVVLIFPSIGYAAYSEPAGSPPSYDPAVISEIINTAGPYASDATGFQQKIGSLTVGSAADPKKLCLNPVTAGTDSSTAYCITSWDQIAPPNTGFLRLFDGNSSNFGRLPPFGNGTNTSTAIQDSGYVGWQANASNLSTAQLFSYIAETPSGTFNSGGAVRPAAIRAEVDSGTNFAGEFLGTLGIVGFGSGAPELCLNNEGSTGTCISKWSDIYVNTQIVNLQNLQLSQHFLDQGQTATVGTLVVNAVVTGQPVMTTPLTYSCGDNICQTPSETTLTCSADCK